jgi:uncharacterized protein
MKIRYSILAAAMAAAIALIPAVAPHSAMAAGKQKAKKKLLVVSVTKGFRHGSIAMAERTIQELGEKTGEWDTDFVRSDEDMASKMTVASLKQYDGVVFANTTGDLPLPDPKGFYDYIKAGHGFAAMHSGSDTLHSKDGKISDYVDMLGGEFETHHQRCVITPVIEDPNHPATRALVKAQKAGATPPSLDEIKSGHSYVADNKWTVYDEIYILKNNDRTKLHVLLSVDKHPSDGSADADKPGTHMVSWTKTYGKGLVFYTILGHTPDDSANGHGMWTDPLFQAHITGGLEYVLGLKKGSAKLSAPAP